MMRAYNLDLNLPNETDTSGSGGGGGGANISAEEMFKNQFTRLYDLGVAKTVEELISMFAEEATNYLLFCREEGAYTPGEYEIISRTKEHSKEHLERLHRKRVATKVNNVIDFPTITKL